MSRAYRTIDEAAVFLGVAAGTVRRWIRDGELDVIRTPGGKKMHVTLWSVLRRSGVPAHELPGVFANMIGVADAPERKPGGRGSVSVPAGAPRGIVDRPIPPRRGRGRPAGMDANGAPVSESTRRLVEVARRARDEVSASLAAEKAADGNGRG